MKNGNILEEIWLNKENISKAYEAVGRMDIKKTSFTLLKLLEDNNFKQEWLENYRADMINYLQEKNKPNNLFPFDFAEDILKVLQIIDNKQEYLKRVLSIKCFGDSKYFEQNIEHIIIRIIKKYLLDNQIQEDCSNDEILLEVRNFKVSRNIRILWRYGIYDR